MSSASRKCASRLVRDWMRPRHVIDLPYEREVTEVRARLREAACERTRCLGSDGVRETSEHLCDGDLALECVATVHVEGMRAARATQETARALLQSTRHLATRTVALDTDGDMR